MFMLPMCNMPVPCILKSWVMPTLKFWSAILYIVLSHYGNCSVLHAYCSHTPTLLFISAFHLSYNMLLNQMRSEDGDPEKLLRFSFYQFQADQALPDLEVCWHVYDFLLFEVKNLLMPWVFFMVILHASHIYHSWQPSNTFCAFINSLPVETCTITHLTLYPVPASQFICCYELILTGPVGSSFSDFLWEYSLGSKVDSFTLKFNTEHKFNMFLLAPLLLLVFLCMMLHVQKRSVGMQAFLDGFQSTSEMYPCTIRLLLDH